MRPLTKLKPFETHHSKEKVMSAPTHVLIVEDTEETAIFLAQILEDHGYPYQVARNGVEAISALRENPPDLVLLDIMMPKKSGIHVFREMRNDPGLKDVPIIVVTGVSEVTGVDLHTGEEESNQDEGDVVAHQLGSALGDKIRSLTPNGLVEKPIDPSLLIGQIQNLLSGRTAEA
jgi:CheY-like chemotaxis protein